MVSRTFEQTWDGQLLEVYINSDNKLFVAIHPDTDDYDLYQYQCTVLDIDDAVELYVELGELIKQMKDGQAPEN